MLRYEASIRELFYRLRTANRSFVPQDDREIGMSYVETKHLFTNLQSEDARCIIDTSFLGMTGTEVKKIVCLDS
jgi:hypothetical protein